MAEFRKNEKILRDEKELLVNESNILKERSKKLISEKESSVRELQLIITCLRNELTNLKFAGEKSKDELKCSLMEIKRLEEEKKPANLGSLEREVINAEMLEQYSQEKLNQYILEQKEKEKQRIVDESLNYITKNGKSDIYNENLNIFGINTAEEKNTFALKFSRSLRDATDLMNEYKGVEEKSYLEVSKRLEDQTIEKVTRWCQGISEEGLYDIKTIFSNCAYFSPNDTAACAVGFEKLVKLSIELSIIYKYLKGRRNRNFWEKKLYANTNKVLSSFMYESSPQSI